MSVSFHFGNFVFCSFRCFSCVIFFRLVSVCKARQARLLKNVNKHFHNFIGQNQRKTKNEKRKWDEMPISRVKTHIELCVALIELTAWLIYKDFGSSSSSQGGGCVWTLRLFKMVGSKKNEPPMLILSKVLWGIWFESVNYVVVIINMWKTHILLLSSDFILSEVFASNNCF